MGPDDEDMMDDLPGADDGNDAMVDAIEAVLDVLPEKSLEMYRELGMTDSEIASSILDEQRSKWGDLDRA